MLTETLRTQIEQLRSRILRAADLRAANAPIPDGLEPSDEELISTITEWRKARAIEATSAPAKRRSAKAEPSPLQKNLSNPSFDLKDLFSK